MKLKSALAGLTMGLMTSSAALAANVTITWNPSTDNVGVVGYHVYRNGLEIGTSTTTTYTDSTAEASTTYTYTIRAADRAGNLSAPVSGNITTATLVAPMDPVFVPLHTYFLSPGGNDGADGLTPATAWATPNHPVVCGDVILVAPGNYATAQFGANFQEPTACPSTQGGIDNGGGIYFVTLLCAGSDLGGGVGVGNGCNITTAGFGDPGVLINFGNSTGPGVARNPVSHWAVSGMHLDAGNTVPQNDGECCRGIELGRACGEGTGPPQVSHHIAAINTLITNVRQGMIFGPNNCGNGGNRPDQGSDYVAAVGLITQNATQENFGGFVCIASIDLIGTNDNADTLPGTHFYAYNNYGMNNHNANCEYLNTSNEYDVEFIMIDTPNNGGTTGLHVIANNIGFNSGRACIQLTGTFTYVLPTHIYNNTCYGNVQLHAGSGDGSGGEVATNGGGSVTSGWTISFYNNILRTSGATAPNGAIIFAMALNDLDYPGWREGTQLGAGKENIEFGFASFDPSGCNRSWPAGACAPSNTTPPFISAYSTVSGVPSPPAPLTNFYVDPLFSNIADLVNHNATPNCTGFETTTQCMGWNARTGVLTALSFISDLTATCPQCAGKGFQKPSTTCGGPVTVDYPNWLKGVVYLHAESGFTAGTVIKQKAGLVTRPCGL